VFLSPPPKAVADVVWKTFSISFSLLPYTDAVGVFFLGVGGVFLFVVWVWFCWVWGVLWGVRWVGGWGGVGGFFFCRPLPLRVPFDLSPRAHRCLFSAIVRNRSSCLPPVYSVGTSIFPASFPRHLPPFHNEFFPPCPPERIFNHRFTLQSPCLLP